MKNKIKLSELKSISRKELRSIYGGAASGCPSSGCYSLYFSSGTGECAVPINGETCFGTESGGRCCL